MVLLGTCYTYRAKKFFFREDCWNGNVAGKYYKNKIHE